MTSWYSANKLEWYNVIILSAQVSGFANSAVSLLGVVTSLYNKESKKLYFSANVSIFCIADLVLDNLFCVRCKYKSLKCWLIKYHACIFFTAGGKWVPFKTVLCVIFNILSISTCFDNKPFVLVCLYSVDLATLVVPENMIFQTCCTFLILHLLDVGNFLQNLH